MCKILHVEDDADIRDICKISFEIAGFSDVVQCENGYSALAVSDDIEPDLLLLDYMMPGMTGKELLEHLRKKPGYGSVPAVFISALVQDSEQEEMLKAGAVAVITKPFDPMTLGNKILSIIGRSQG